jgi:hypothetical protein
MEELEKMFVRNRGWIPLPRLPIGEGKTHEVIEGKRR